MADRPLIPYDPALLRLFARSALVNQYVEPDWPVSFSGLLTAFLVNDDPLSVWFRAFVRDTPSERRLLEGRKLDPAQLPAIQQRSLPPTLATLAAAVEGPAPAAAGEMFLFEALRESWRVTESARALLTAADRYRQQQSERPDQPLGVHHLMAAFIYDPGEHASEVTSLGLDRVKWSGAFLGQVISSHPQEFNFWKDVHKHEFGQEPELAPGGEAGPSTHLATDRWTREDALGYRAYAYAIYRFMIHPKTSAPLTIGIQAPWGGGKTSLMRMLQEFLDPQSTSVQAERLAGAEALTMREALATLREGDPGKPPKSDQKTAETAAAARAPQLIEPEALPERRGRPFTIWFNAWQYATSDQVWAGLADAILRQVAAQLCPKDRAKFWLRLNRDRVDHQRLNQAWQADVFREWLALERGLKPSAWWLIALGVIASAAISLADWGQSVIKGDVVGWAGITLSLLGALAQLLSEYRTAREKAASEYGDKRANLWLGEYLDAPDYRAGAGFVHQAVRDLGRVLACLDDLVELGAKGQAARVSLVVFVDDLDRCTPENVAHVVEGINGFLAGDFPKCMFVIGMDPEMVAAALEAAQSEVLARLPKDATTPIGWRFMDKFVQLPFVIPPADWEAIDRYVNSLLAAELPPAAGAAASPAQTGGPPTPGISEPPAEAWDTQRQRIDAGVEAFTDANADIRRALRDAATQFSHNPREVKRFLNAYRFQYFLWRARPKAERLTPVLIQRWVLLSMKWPDVVRWLRRSGGRERRPGANEVQAAASRLKRLEAVAERVQLSDDMPTWQAEVEKEFRVKKEELPWLNDDDLRRFFREAALAEDQRLSKGEGLGLW